jgi:hypothetical protein
MQHINRRTATAAISIILLSVFLLVFVLPHWLDG